MNEQDYRNVIHVLKKGYYDYELTNVNSDSLKSIKKTNDQYLSLVKLYEQHGGNFYDELNSILEMYIEMKGGFLGVKKLGQNIKTLTKKSSSENKLSSENKPVKLSTVEKILKIPDSYNKTDTSIRFEIEQIYKKMTELNGGNYSTDKQKKHSDNMVTIAYHVYCQNNSKTLFIEEHRINGYNNLIKNIKDIINKIKINIEKIGEILNGSNSKIKGQVNEINVKTIQEKQKNNSEKLSQCVHTWHPTNARQSIYIFLDETHDKFKDILRRSNQVLKALNNKKTKINDKDMEIINTNFSDLQKITEEVHVKVNFLNLAKPKI